MKYLFFDIECANCFNGIGKMCEFGYVLCDENMLIMKSEDIPMSPGNGRGSRFHLKGRKHEKDLELAYDYGYYYSSPEFPQFYERIKRLMEDPDTICLAYSMNNDIQHLHNACIRYNKEPLNYECYDVQKMVGAYLEHKGQMSLYNACKTIVGPNSTVRLQNHLSRDDAMMERLIFDAIRILTGKNPIELIEGSLFAKTNSLEYMEKVKNRLNKKKSRYAGDSLYESIVASEEEIENPEHSGKRYIVSNEVKHDLNMLKSIIVFVENKKGIFSNHIGKSDYFIVNDDKNKEEIINNLKYPYDGEIMTYKEFISSLNKNSKKKTEVVDCKS